MYYPNSLLSKSGTYTNTTKSSQLLDEADDGKLLDVMGFHCFLAYDDASMLRHILVGSRTMLHAVAEVIIDPKDIIAYGCSDNIVNRTSWLPPTVVVSKMTIEDYDFQAATFIR